MKFRNRYEAALMLIPHLEEYCEEPGVVLAVPRRGVPMAYEIAKYFNCPLQLLMTKKIGHPRDPERAIGAVGLEDHLIDMANGIPLRYIEEQIRTIRKSLQERYARFMKDEPQVSIEDRIVIVTDNGVASGNSILASIRMMRQKHPRKIVVAVPVAPVAVADKLRRHADDFICLHETYGFTALRDYYADLSEVPDEEIIPLLRDANKFGAVA